MPRPEIAAYARSYETDFGEIVRNSGFTPLEAQLSLVRAALAVEGPPCSSSSTSGFPILEK